MAKLGLVFICVFLMVQWSLAARVARDAPETPAKTEESDANSFNINEALSNISQGIQKVLSKENVDKFMENLGKTGDQLKQFGQGLIDKAQEKAAEISNGAKKEPTTT